MKRKVDVEIKPTPREVADEIWKFDAIEQADLILAMAQKYKNETGKFCLQLEYVKDEMAEKLISEEILDALCFFTQVTEYIKDAKEKKDEERRH